MKNKKLLVLIPALLLTLGMASCQKKSDGGESKPVDTSDSGAETEVHVESVSLDKETLELGIGDSTTLKATVLPANATNTSVTWTSSDAAVAEVNERGKVTAKAEGQATITVTTEDGAKTATCLVKVVTALHGTTEEDPLTVAEAIEMAEALEDGAKTDSVYYIKGTVTAIREAYSSFGNMSLEFKVEDKLFVGYRLAVEAEVAAIIGKNSEVLFNGQIMKYVSSSGAVTLETAQGTGNVISATQGDIQTGHGYAQDDPFTADEALAKAMTLENNAKEDSTSYTKGVVKEITDPYGSFGNITFTFVTKDGVFSAYRVTPAADLITEEKVSCKINVGSEVLVSGQLTHYHKDASGTEGEEGYKPAQDSYQIAQGGTVLTATGGETPEEHEEPAVVNATMAEVWADESGNGAKKFHVENVKLYAFATNKGVATEAASKYGNALLGEQGEYFAYGLTATATALTWNATAGVYQFANPQDFLTNETTKELGAGAVLDLDVIRADYSGTKEVVCVITAVKGGGETPQEHEEPAVVNATMAEVWADESGNGAKKFHVTDVKLNAFATNKGVATDAASKYGNALLGEQGEYFSYGLTATATALAWNATAGVYEFTNPQDFLTNETTKDLNPGAVLDLDVIRADYKETKEVVCVITAVKSNPTPVQPVEIPVLTGEGKTRVQGADAFIYIDNSNLKLTDAIVPSLTIEVSNFAVALSSETPDESKDAAQNYVTGGSAAVVLNNPAYQFAYANESEILMYVKMDKGLDAAWKMKISFTLTVSMGDLVATKDFVFVGADLSDDAGGTTPVVGSTLTLDFSSDISGLKVKADVTKDEAYEATLGGFKYTVINAYGTPINNHSTVSYLMMNSKGYGSRSFFGNKDAMPKNIKSVEIFTTSGAADDPKYSVVTSATALTAATPVEEPTVIAKNSSYKFEFTDANPYFGITTETNKNAQILKIVITFVE